MDDVQLPELISPEDYNAEQSKFEACIRWIFTKSIEGQTLQKLPELFVEIDELQRLPTSAVVNGLTSAAVYVQACTRLFPNAKLSSNAGHREIIEFVCRHGFYVEDSQGHEVSETSLRQLKPLNQSSHVAVVGALMQYHASRVLSTDRVVSEVRLFAKFSASSELPTTLDDSALFWANKTCAALLARHATEKQGQVVKGEEGGVVGPDRLELEDIRDISDGRCLAALVSFYRPDIIPTTAICLTENIGIADSLYNLQLFANACQCLNPRLSQSPNPHQSHQTPNPHLSPASYLHSLTVIDLFYSRPTLHNNILCLLADLFLSLCPAHAISAPAVTDRPAQPSAPVPSATSQIDPPSSSSLAAGAGILAAPAAGVTTAVAAGSKTAASGSKTAGAAAAAVGVQISEATRRSFQRHSPDSDKIATIVSPVGAAVLPGNSVLLPKRRPHTTQRQEAWGPDSSVTSTLPFQTNSLVPSPAKSSPRDRASAHCETSSVTGGAMTSQHFTAPQAQRQPARSSMRVLEPLVPARLRASKEKNASKEVECGENTVGKGMEGECMGKDREGTGAGKGSEGLCAGKGIKDEYAGKAGSSSRRSINASDIKKIIEHETKQYSSDVTGNAGSGDSSSTTPSDGYRTPTADSSPLPSSISTRTFNNDTPLSVEKSQTSSRSNVLENALNRLDVHQLGKSYVISQNNEACRKEDGLKYVECNRGGLNDRCLSRAKCDKSEPSENFVQQSNNKDNILSKKPGDHDNVGEGKPTNGNMLSNKTSFAQLKNDDKRSNDENGSVLSASPQFLCLSEEQGPRLPKKDLIEREIRAENEEARSRLRKTTFAALPTQTTTWADQQKQQRAGLGCALSENKSAGNGLDGLDMVSPLRSELKMRLEEKKRGIVSQKQRNMSAKVESRQRLGEQAFMHAVLARNKPNPTREDNDDKECHIATAEGHKKLIKYYNNSEECLPVTRNKSNTTRDTSSFELNNSKPSFIDHEKLAAMRFDNFYGVNERCGDNKKTFRTDIENERNISTEFNVNHGNKNTPVENEKFIAAKRTETITLAKNLNRDLIMSKKIEEEKEGGRRRGRGGQSEQVDLGEGVKLYDTAGLSLDQLSSNLTALQEEISRLSEQQDHITNLVRLKPTDSNQSNQVQTQSSPMPPTSLRSQTGVWNGSNNPQTLADGAYTHHRSANPASYPSHYGMPVPQSSGGGFTTPVVSSVPRYPYQHSVPTVPSPFLPYPVSHIPPSASGGVYPVQYGLGAGPSHLLHSPSSGIYPQLPTSSPMQQNPYFVSSSSISSAQLYSGHSMPGDYPSTGTATGLFRPQVVDGSVYASQGTFSIHDGEVRMSSEHWLNSTQQLQQLEQQQIQRQQLLQIEQQQIQLQQLQHQIMQHQQEKLRQQQEQQEQQHHQQEHQQQQEPHHLQEQRQEQEHQEGYCADHFILNPSNGVQKEIETNIPMNIFSVIGEASNLFTDNIVSESSSKIRKSANNNLTVSAESIKNLSSNKPERLEFRLDGESCKAMKEDADKRSQVLLVLEQSSNRVENDNSLHPGTDNNSLPQTGENSSNIPQQSHQQPYNSSHPKNKPPNVKASVNASDSDNISQQSHAANVDADSPSPLLTSPSLTSPLVACDENQTIRGSNSNEIRVGNMQRGHAAVNTGFFIGFDDNGSVTTGFDDCGVSRKRRKPLFVGLPPTPTPTKSKSALPSPHNSDTLPHFNNKTLTTSITTTSITTTSITTALITTPPIATAPATTAGGYGIEIETIPNGKLPKAAAMIVIGQDPATLDETELLEMERRKQRLWEQQQKRREELERKRIEQEIQQSRIREMQRLRQEEANERRVEEKSRRDAIFNQYIQRKTTFDQDDDQSRRGITPHPPVIRRQKSAAARSIRPKSQPPAMWEEAEGEGNSVGEKGVEGRKEDTGNRVGKLRVSRIPTAKSVERMNSVPTRLDAIPTELAFGGLTHRRPSTPDSLRNGALMRSPASSTLGLADRTDCSSEHGQETSSAVYAGPRLYVKPSQKSNRNIIINALSHSILAGIVNTDVKNKVLEEIERSDSNHFIILFRDGRMQYRGLYTFNPDAASPGGTNDAIKIHGVGPKQLSDKQTDKFFKYNSGGKTFSEITSTKHLTATVDAVTVHTSVWAKSRTNATPGGR